MYIYVLHPVEESSLDNDPTAQSRRFQQEMNSGECSFFWSAQLNYMHFFVFSSWSMATIDIFRGKIERMDNFNQFHMWVTRISLTLTKWTGHGQIMK